VLVFARRLLELVSLNLAGSIINVAVAWITRSPSFNIAFLAKRYWTLLTDPRH